MRQSIYKIICEAVNHNGVLEPSFILPDEKPEAEMKWAPGAFDGVIFYHMGGGEFNPENVEYKSLTEIVKLASDGNIDEGIKKAEGFACTGVVLPHIDDLHKFIGEQQDVLDSGNILLLAYRLMVEGTLKEMVKMGLAILELFDTNQSEDFKRPIRTLALCDEFTLYSGFIIPSWDRADEELFDIVKKVEGWGRVHLIRILKADTEEIKTWLLENGVHNAVLPAYSGLDCYEKTDFLEYLKSPMSKVRYQGMADIISALLDEGPVPGISEIEERKELLRLFLQVTSNRNDLDSEDYGKILELIDYLADEGNELTDPLPQAKMLIDDKAKDVVTRDLQQGRYFGIAKRMGLAYEPYAYKAVMNNLKDNEWWAAQLIESGYKSDELLAYIEKEIKLGESNLKQDNQEGKLVDVPGIFDYVLQAIRHQVSKGEKFVFVGLTSPERRVRNGSVKVLQCWIEDTNKSLKEISPTLYAHLAEIVDDESSPELQEKMREILDNKYSGKNKED